MATIQVAPTSFWSMLPNITSNAINSFEHSRDRRNAEEDRQRKMLLEQLGITQAAAQAGGATPELANLYKQLGINITPGETSMQLQNRILGTPDKSVDLSAAGLPMPVKIPGMASFTDNELRKAQLPTRTQNLVEAASGEKAKSEITLTPRVADIKRRALAGEYITPNEADLAGIKPTGQAQLEAAGTALDFVGKQAGGYVKEWLGKHGGRVIQSGPGANMESMLAEAYGSFMERFGKNIPAEQQSDARAKFAEAAYAVLQDQNELDIKRATIEASKENARYRASGAGDPTRLAGRLTALGTSISNQLNKWPKLQQEMFMTAMLNGADPKTFGPSMGAYQEFQQIYARLENVRRATGMALSGQADTPEFEAIMAQVSSENPTPTAGSAPSPAPEASSRKQLSDGRYVITPAEKAQLQRNGWWDASKYVVE